MSDRGEPIPFEKQPQKSTKSGKYLVTGGAGYIGSYVSQLLLERSKEVHILDLRPCQYPEGIQHRGDISSRDWWDAVGAPDVIFHLAAVSRISACISDPAEAFSTNVEGTWNVLEFARKTGAKVVFVSTSCCYDPTLLTPYHLTKWLGEEMCQRFARDAGISVGIARPFNVYGTSPYCHVEPELVMEVFDTCVRQNLPLPIMGEGTQTRDFIHVHDVAHALLKIADGRWAGEIFNIGTGHHHSINEIAAAFKKTRIETPGRVFDVDNRQADIEETERKLGWKAKTHILEYIAREYHS